MSPFLLYWGCWGAPGHYLWNRNKGNAQDPVPFGFADGTLDGSRIFLPHPEVVGQGRLTRVFVNDECVTVLAWWDRTFDKRPACNSAIICSGWESADELWARFGRVYPALAAQLKMPTLSNSAEEAKP